MAGSTAPILLAGGISFANRWLGEDKPDLRIIVATGIAVVGFAGLEQVPGMAPVATGIAWIAVLTVFLAGKPSPADTLLKITGGL
jgi:hypothetical protein